MSTPMSYEDAADGLREQAASYRRLANRAHTGSGWIARTAFAAKCDNDARRFDPRSLRR